MAQANTNNPDLRAFLEQLSLRGYRRRLNREGVHKVEHLQDITEDTLKRKIRMTGTEITRLMREINKIFGDPTPVFTPPIPVPSPPVTPPIPDPPSPARSPSPVLSPPATPPIPESFYIIEKKPPKIQLDAIHYPFIQPKIEENFEIQETNSEMSIKYKLFNDLPPQEQRIDQINTREMYYYELVNIICQNENLDSNTTVELYSSEGYPLACSPSSYVLKLVDWHLETYEPELLLYAIPRNRIYTDKQIRYFAEHALPHGHDIIQVQYIDAILTDCSTVTFYQLLSHIQLITGIPTHLMTLYLHNDPIIVDKDQILESLKIINGIVVSVRTKNEFWDMILYNNFTFKQYHPTWQGEQSSYGTSVFFSCLYTLFGSTHGEHIDLRTLGFIRSITGCPPLIHALNLLISGSNITLPHIVAITEIMVKLFKVSKPKPLRRVAGTKSVKDCEVTEHSFIFWSYFIKNAMNKHKDTEIYESFTIECFISKDRVADYANHHDVNGINRVIENENCEENYNSMSKYKRLVTSFPINAIEAKVWIGEPIDLCLIDLSREWKDLEKEFRDIYPLSIQSLHNINTCIPPCLIPISNENVGVYIMQAKKDRKSIYFDVMIGKDVLFCPEELNERIKQNPPKWMDFLPKVQENLSPKQILTRIPEEIVIVLLNVGCSLKEEYFDGITKENSTMEALMAFSNKCFTYHLKHAVGIVLFTEESASLQTLSENFQCFNSEFSSLPSGSSTEIYDAILSAINILDEFIDKFPNCRNVPRRILCITDGEDSQSKSTPEIVTSLLIENSIIMDVVLLATNKLLIHFIAKASGGYSFQPKSTEELVSIFENEPVLTMKMRKYIKPLFSKKQKVLFDTISPDFDTIPEHKLPEERLRDSVTTIHKSLAPINRQKFLQVSLDTCFTKRLLQELAHWSIDPNKYFEIFPCEKRIDFWQLLLTGPEGTNYENSLFRLYIEFGPKYPIECPNIRFITPIYHCNINQSGKICHSILDTFYNRDLRIKTILDYICGLLMDPTPDDPLDISKASLLLSDPIEYNKNAREHSMEHAIDIKFKPHIRAELLGIPGGKEDMQLPNHTIVCPLTLNVFVDPVSNIEGDTYEREAIEAYLDAGNALDPISEKPLKKSDLQPNIDLKYLADEYRRELEIFFLS